MCWDKFEVFFKTEKMLLRFDDTAGRIGGVKCAKATSSFLFFGRGVVNCKYVLDKDYSSTSPKHEGSNMLPLS